MLRFKLIITFCLIMVALGANPYVVNRFQDANGKTIEEIVVPGIPEALRQPGPIATPSRSAVILNDVPKLNWCYGCSATSAAMMAGYYDRNGYPNMYEGPTNGGVFPGTNSSWGYGECPLSATHQGYDGLSSQGHVDRFWTGSVNSGDDPFGTGNPTATYANCTADYMGTNQDWWSNSDGGTTFYTYNDGSPIYDYTGGETASPRKRDGIRGFRLFMESRGYEVTTNYNQKILGYEGNTQGYTLAQFQDSIDNGIPVMIHIEGHTMVGVGYESTNSTIYIHDTWDHSMHSMTWGGTYSRAAHYSVSVIELASAPVAGIINWIPSAFSQNLELHATATQNLGITNSGSGTLDYECAVAGGSGAVLQENFEASSIPASWTQENVSGSGNPWTIASGGHSGNPDAAYEGSYNVRLFNFSFTPMTVKLISPALDLSGATAATLSFWHAQDNWGSDQDELRIYYKNSFGGAWNILATYTDEVSSWTQRTMALPNLSSTYYIAFEGTTNYGYGVCLDAVEVTQQSAGSSWLTINSGYSYSASIASGAPGHSIPIGFDAAGLEAGNYSKTITITSNCTINPVVEIPVNLTVLSPLSVPQEPTIEQVPGSSRVKISWNAVSGNPSGYKVYYCALPDFSSEVSLLGTTTASRTYFVDFLAGTRTKGFYRVIAFRN